MMKSRFSIGTVLGSSGAARKLKLLLARTRTVGQAGAPERAGAAGPGGKPEPAAPERPAREGGEAARRIAALEAQLEGALARIEELDQAVLRRGQPSLLRATGVEGLPSRDNLNGGAVLISLNRNLGTPPDEVASKAYPAWERDTRGDLMPDGTEELADWGAKHPAFYAGSGRVAGSGQLRHAVVWRYALPAHDSLDAGDNYVPVLAVDLDAAGAGTPLAGESFGLMEWVKGYTGDLTVLTGVSVAADRITFTRTTLVVTKGVVTGIEGGNNIVIEVAGEEHDAAAADGGGVTLTEV